MEYGINLAAETPDTVTADDGQIGQKIGIVISGPFAHSHSLAYSIGGHSGYITGDGVTSLTEVIFREHVIFFEIPAAFGSLIPADAMSAICTLTLTTYGGTEQIGLPQYTTFTVRIPAGSVPTVRGAVEDVNPVTLALTGNKSRIVRNASTMRCTITASAMYGALIAEKRIGTKTITGNTRDFSTYAFSYITFAATDSRGLTGQVRVVPDFLEYIAPTCAAETYRNEAGPVLRVTGTAWDGNFGRQRNAITLRYAIDGGSAAAVAVTVTDGRFDMLVHLSGLAPDVEHEITVEVSDLLKSAQDVAMISPAVPLIGWGAGRVFVNGAAEVRELHSLNAQLQIIAAELPAGSEIELQNDAACRAWVLWLCATYPNRANCCFVSAVSNRIGMVAIANTSDVQLGVPKSCRGVIFGGDSDFMPRLIGSNGYAWSYAPVQVRSYGGASADYGISDLANLLEPCDVYLTSNVTGGLPWGLTSGTGCACHVEQLISRNTGTVYGLIQTVTNMRTNKTARRTQYSYGKTPSAALWTAWNEEALT